MRRSQKYLLNYWFILLAAASVYVATAGTTLLLARTGAHTEIYPIFAWDLFSVVPNQTADYGLRIVALDGTPLESPAFLETLHDVGTSFSVATHMAIQELGAAQKADDLPRQKRLQALLAGTALGGLQRAVRYELVLRRYDVLERYRDGLFSELTVIALDSAP